MDLWEQESEEEEDLIYSAGVVDRNELFIYSRQLADCKIDKVTIQYTLSTGLKMEALLKCYEQELEEEKETEDKEDTRQRPERTYPTIRKSSKAYWKTVQFANSSVHFVNIFFDVYRDKISEMERVYKYEIVRHGRHIRVYMDEDVNINKMIKRDIIGMRNKLVLHYRFDEQICAKIKYSRQLKQRLETRKVHSESIKFRHGILLVFYSIEIKGKEIAQIVNEQLKYHISILPLWNYALSRSCNEALFLLLNACISDTCTRVTEEYELLVEPNADEACYVLHDKHPTFASGPLRSIYEALSCFNIFSLHVSNQPELNQYLNDLGSAKEYLKTIVVRSAKAVLLLVETRDLFVDDVKQLLNVFTENMNLAMEIKLCFHHHQSEEEMTRVEVIAQRFRFIVERRTELTGTGDAKCLLIRFKEFSELRRQSKAEVIYRFFCCYLLRVQFEQFQGMAEPENEVKQEKIQKQTANKVCAKQVLVVKQQPGVIKTQIQWPYLPPNLSPLVEKCCDRSAMRAHKLEGLLNKDSGCQFKAWKLNVNESLSLPSPEEINRDCILTKEIHFTAKFPSAVRPETIDNYQVGEFGYVVYFSEKQQMYVPTHIFERLQ